MGRLDGKVAIVTGAARGMGAETARVFVREGARVALTDVLDEFGERTAEELGEAARYLHLDVTEEATWSRVVTEVEAAFGRIDVLINNAGILHTAPVLECEPADFRRVIDVNLMGPYLGIRAVAPVMAKTGGGSIVNISSIQGLTGRAGTPAYTASKFGVRGLTKTVALELGALGIRVNSVHPGGVDTDLLRGVSGGDIPIELIDKAHAHLPVPRVGRADDVAHCSLFLACDESAYVSGAELVVDGGMTAGYPAPPGRR